MVSYGWSCRVLAVTYSFHLADCHVLVSNYQHYWHSEEHLSRGCIRKAHKKCSCWIFLESIKIPNSLKSLVFLQNYGKGRTLSMFSEAFLKKFKSNYSNNIWGTFCWKFLRVAKKASSILDSSLSKAVKFSHTVMFILHYFHLRRYRILT